MHLRCILATLLAHHTLLRICLFITVSMNCLHKPVSRFCLYKTVFNNCLHCFQDILRLVLRPRTRVLFESRIVWLFLRFQLSLVANTKSEFTSHSKGIQWRMIPGGKLWVETSRVKWCSLFCQIPDETPAFS